MPKAVSLFSGCGGSDAGVIAAGFDVGTGAPHCVPVQVSQMGVIRQVKGARLPWFSAEARTANSINDRVSSITGLR